jgi:hypothetical protein
MRLIRLRLRDRVMAVVAAAICALALASGAYGAFLGLPSSGQQVNDDPPTIDPGQNAGLSDLTSGSLIAGNPRVPWAAFAQDDVTGSRQIFVRAFKGGQWQTEGFPQSLNEDSTQVANAPSIDFTGPNRTVPWVGWVEPSPVLGGVQEIFASRFAAQAGAQNGGQWVHEGQQVSGTAPSLNVNTNRDADAPSLIGGTTTAGANPAPWLTWQEADNGTTAAASGDPAAPKESANSTFQIFVSHAVPASGGVCPPGTKPSHGTSSVGNFCFQQVGIDRVAGPSAAQLDPSLNVDPNRDGIQADIAFTGVNDTVPWVVWYENSDNGNVNDGQNAGEVNDGLLNADMVFAARAIPDTSGDGGFHWQVVGLGTAGRSASQDILNTSGSNHAGDCATTQALELECSLDADQTLSDAQALTDGNGAENPQVTAGTMVPGKPTTPWITWDESNTNGGQHAVFVARLDAAGDHFDLLNNGQPISNSGLESTRPDIVFSHNTPYVTWHEQVSATQALTFVGHFEGNPADPVFHLDTPHGISTTPTGAVSDDDLTDIRSPIASTCPDDPFTADGSACQGGAIGTPFFAYNDGTSPRQLLAEGYTPGTVTTGTASAVLQNSATIAGTVNTDGTHALVHFDFGTSTAYGQSTAGQLLPPAAGVTTPFSASVAGLPAGTTIHYRAVAQTDFGTVDGADETFTTAGSPPPPAVAVLASGTAAVKGGVARVKVECRGASGEQCDGTLKLTLRVRVTTGRGGHRHRRLVTLPLGRAGVQLNAGESGIVTVRLSNTAKQLLGHGRLGVTATIALSDGTSTSARLTLVAAKHNHRRS